MPHIDENKMFLLARSCVDVELGIINIEALINKYSFGGVDGDVLCNQIYDDIILLWVKSAIETIHNPEEWSERLA